MASTYSNLKVQLMGTGENSGTWGTITNTNLGTALEEAIVGSADVTFSSADVTLTWTDSNSSQTARNLRLNLTGTVSAAQNLIVPAIEKVYLVNNTLSYAITVKNSSGTGIAVPAGKTMLVYNNGTNVVDAVTHLTSLTLASALSVASGGTGTNTSTGSGNVVLSTSPTLVTPALGTPSSGTLTSCTGLPVSTGISGLGTNVATFLATPSSSNLAAAVTDETGSGALVFATSPTLVTPALGTPSSGTLTSCTGLPLTTGVTGTLPVANGGTGATSISSGSLVKGNGTSAFSAASASDITSAIGSTAVTNATNASNATSGSTLSSQVAKAWVSFTSSGSIRKSYNVSSITKDGTGIWTVNYTSALADSNYSWVSNVVVDTVSFGMSVVGYGTTIYSTTQTQICQKAGNGSTTFDGSYVNFAVFD